MTHQEEARAFGDENEEDVERIVTAQVELEAQSHLEPGDDAIVRTVPLPPTCLSGRARCILCGVFSSHLMAFFALLLGTLRSNLGLKLIAISLALCADLALLAVACFVLCRSFPIPENEMVKDPWFSLFLKIYLVTIIVSAVGLVRNIRGVMHAE